MTKIVRTTMSARCQAEVMRESSMGEMSMATSADSWAHVRMKGYDMVGNNNNDSAAM
jgi:hypothetical protein